jgi:hypothetical protein
MEPVSEEEAIPTIQQTLRKLASALRGRQRNKLNFDEDVEDLRTDYAVRDAEFSQLITEYTEVIVANVAAHYKLLFPALKTREFREGTLSVRAATSFPFDAKKAEKWLRARGLWRDNSIPQPRKIDKDKIQEDTALVAQMPDEIARFVKVNRLTIKLPDPQLSDVKEDLPALRQEVPAPEDSD